MKMTRTEIQKRYREKNREKVNEMARIWREKNVLKIRRNRKAYNRRVYAEQKAKVIDYKKSKGCFRCKINLPCVLEFHHIDPLTKENQISDMIGKGSWQRLEKEIAKCEVVCRNCHSIIHDSELGDEFIHHDNHLPLTD